MDLVGGCGLRYPARVGLLRCLDGDAVMALPGRCLIGRGPTCDLVLPQKNVSGQHAALEWNGGAWEIRDLGSRNGTYVDDRRLAADGRCNLVRDARLRFGRESPTWILADTSPPVAMACDGATRVWRFAEGGYLSLPSPEDHECSIYPLPDGSWVVETGSETRPLEDRSMLTTSDGSVWRVYLPVSLLSTMKEGDLPRMLAFTRMRFRHSLDEEQVEMTGFLGDARLDFHIRAHHYPLLLLARRRLADRRSGLAEPDQGWVSVDDLLQMLGMSEPHLNISIHRARTALSQAGILDAASLIERRTRTRRIRIGVQDLTIERLDAVPAMPGPVLNR